MDFKEENEKNTEINENAESCIREEADQNEIAEPCIREDTEQNEIPNAGAGNARPFPDFSETEIFEKKHYIVLMSLLVSLAILMTFVITYVVMSVSHRKDMDSLAEQYSIRLESVGEFRSIIEMYNSLPEELRNIETYEKLAYIDYYYRTNYVGEIDEDYLVYMVANGYIMGAQDMFGGYYTADEFQTVLGEAEGNTVGIGVYVTADIETKGVRISYVMKDGPANKAGLLPGDIITHVEGQSVTELGYYSAIDLIKGEENTQVKVTVLRDGESLEKTLTREKVNVESVIYTRHETEADVGVIQIIEFNNATTEQFINAVNEAVEIDGCNKLVFDLRGNPGGTLTSVVEILDFMLPSGTIITQRYADGEKTVYTSDDEGVEFEKLYGTGIEMAVLVNGGTASAAELFTCALKDYGKAIVVGEQTYGKGCGQVVLPLYDGSGLVFTTFMYDPPKSENYNGVGIEPDIKQEQSEEASKKNIFELKHNEDDQLKAAIKALK